jgi:hypothetical protein
MSACRRALPSSCRRLLHLPFNPLFDGLVPVA